MVSLSYAIVGLGNPGAQYANTRHNVGFEIADRLAHSLGAPPYQSKFKSLIVHATVDSHRILLIKPQTFMNLSGEAVGEITRFHKLSYEKIVVVYDDIDLPLGELRIRKQGGSGGHNGMKSIIENLGTEEFARFRIGIGREAMASDHVLGKFSVSDREVVSEAITRAVEALKHMISHGMDSAMNAFNRRHEGNADA